MSAARRALANGWFWTVLTSRIVRVTAWLGLLTVTGWLVRAELSRADQPEGVSIVADLVYREAGGRRPRLDVYLPMTAPPTAGWPVLLALHGGGWRGGDKSDYGHALAPLARRGCAVVAINYRLSRPGSPSWPENLDDVRAARHWIDAHASEFGFDRERVAAIGASAGAHLALLCALDDKAPRIRAVIDFYAPTDLSTLATQGTGATMAIHLMLGIDESGFETRAEAASPIRRIHAGAPPVFLIHGAEDRLVPPSQSRAFADALQQAGVPRRLTVLPEARHGFGLTVGARDLVPEILDFLEGVWGNDRR